MTCLEYFVNGFVSCLDYCSEKIKVIKQLRSYMGVVNKKDNV